MQCVRSCGRIEDGPKSLAQVVDGQRAHILNNEGLLQESEREELEALVELSEQLSLIRGEALQILGRQPQ